MYKRQQLTPTSINKNKQFDNNDVMNMMQLFLEQQSKMSNDVNAKLNELTSNVNDQKIKYESSFNELFKRIDESNKKWERNRCKLKENKESGLNQVSSFDSGGNNDDDAFTDDSVILSTNEIIDDKVSENKEKINDNGVSLSVKQVTVNKVSGDVKISNDEILLNINIDNILSNSNDESRKLFEVSNRVVVLSLIHI